MAAVEVALSEDGGNGTSNVNKDGPVLTMMSKRLRALKKKYNRILQIEENKAQGKTIVKEQEEVLKSKPGVAALIDEYEKLRQPLLVAIKEEVAETEKEKERELMASKDNLEECNGDMHQVENGDSQEDKALHEERVDSDENADEKPIQEMEPNYDDRIEHDKAVQNETEYTSYGDEELEHVSHSDAHIADLLKLLYFAQLFDVRSQGEALWRKVHERHSCLSYDFVTDDVTAPLCESDLDALSLFGSLLTSRPFDATVSHQEALESCIQHARLWLLNSDLPIHADLHHVTYSGLRERLDRILSSGYFTRTAELAPAGQYTTKIVVQDVKESAEPEMDTYDSDQVEPEQHYYAGDYVGSLQAATESGLTSSDPAPAANAISFIPEKSIGSNHVLPVENHEDDNQGSPHASSEHEPPQVQQQQSIPATSSQMQQPQNSQGGPRGRGGRGYGGGGRGGRGYGGGRGGRGGGRGTYYNGRGGGQYYDRNGQYYEQNYYPRNNYGGRGGRGGRGGYNNGQFNGPSQAVLATGSA